MQCAPGLSFLVGFKLAWVSSTRELGHFRLVTLILVLRKSRLYFGWGRLLKQVQPDSGGALVTEFSGKSDERLSRVKSYDSQQGYERTFLFLAHERFSWKSPTSKRKLVDSVVLYKSYDVLFFLTPSQKISSLKQVAHVRWPLSEIS